MLHLLPVLLNYILPIFLFHPVHHSLLLNLLAPLLIKLDLLHHVIIMPNPRIKELPRLRLGLLLLPFSLSLLILQPPEPVLHRMALRLSLFRHEMVIEHLDPVVVNSPLASEGGKGDRAVLVQGRSLLNDRGYLDDPALIW